MDEHGESGLTDYQLRFLLRELLEELLRDGEND